MKINKKTVKEKAVSVLLMILIVGVTSSVMFGGDFLALFKPARDYVDVLENGLRAGDRIEGEIYYNLGGFARRYTTTTQSGVEVSSKTNGYFYMIPVGGSGAAAIYVDKTEYSKMERLVEKTDRYISDGTPVRSGVWVSGRVHKMNKELTVLFRDCLEDMGYTGGEIQEMLAANTDGKYLVIKPYDVKMAKIGFTIALTAITVSGVGLLAIWLSAKKSKAKQTQDWEPWT